MPYFLLYPPKTYSKNPTEKIDLPQKDLFPMLSYRSPQNLELFISPEDLWSALGKLAGDKSVTIGCYKAKIIKKLGQGVEGKTFLAEIEYTDPSNNLTNTFYLVIKKINPLFTPLKFLLRQEECNFYLKHGGHMFKFGPRFYYVDPKRHFIVSEVAQPYRMEDHAQFYYKIKADLIETIRNIHGDNFVHHDIKPDNIAFVRDKWRFIDYGMATTVGRPGMGQYEYRYPGQLFHYAAGLLGHNESQEKSFKDDWRRIAILLLQIYHKKSVEEILLDKKYVNKVTVISNLIVRYQIQRLLRDLLQSNDPEERSIGQLLQTPPEPQVFSHRLPLEYCSSLRK